MPGRCPRQRAWLGVDGSQGRLSGALYARLVRVSLAFAGPVYPLGQGAAGRVGQQGESGIGWTERTGATLARTSWPAQQRMSASLARAAYRRRRGTRTVCLRAGGAGQNGCGNAQRDAAKDGERGRQDDAFHDA